MHFCVFILVEIVKIIVVFKFFSREAINTVWCELWGASQTDIALTEFKRRVSIASLWFILTLLIAVVSPDIGIVIDVLGSLAAIFIFVFPGEGSNQKQFS